MDLRLALVESVRGPDARGQGIHAGLGHELLHVLQAGKKIGARVHALHSHSLDAADLASTKTPRGWAKAITCRTAAMFSASGRAEASIITDG